MHKLKLLLLEIKNFEYWDDATVLFADDDGKPHSTILLHGSQESGKSTIGRALRWLLYGDMQGEKIIDKYPNSWADADGNKDPNPKEVQYVIAKYLHPEDDDIITVSRTRSPGSIKTKIEMDIAGEVIGDMIALKWERFFGKVPHSEDDVEFFIRVQQMTETAKSLGAEEDSYQERLLSFVNTEELISRMDEVVHSLKSEYNSAVAASTATKFIAEKERLEGLKENLTVKKAENEITIEQLNSTLAELQDNKPDAEKLAAEAEERRKILANVVPVMSAFGSKFQTFNTNFLKGTNLPLYSHLFYGMLLSKNLENELPNKDQVLASAVDLGVVLDLFSDQLSDDSVSKLSELDKNSSLSNCIALVSAEENSTHVYPLLNEFKQAWDSKRDHEIAMAIMGSKMALDPTKVELAQKSMDDALTFQKDLVELQQENETIQAQIDEYLVKISAEDVKIASSTESGDLSLELYKQWQLALGAYNAVKNSKANYTDAMFEHLIGRIKKFWDEIDAGHSDADIEYDEETRSIYLLDKKTSTHVSLRHSDGGGAASSGQFEKALLCMAFARASLTGLHLPVFIDDAMGDMDPEHKQRAITSAAKHFGQVVFVTNTTDSVVGKVKLDHIIMTLGEKAKGTKSIEYG